MAIRKILVTVSGVPGERASLQTAFNLAQSFSAHVEALHVRPDPRDSIPLLGEGVSGAMVDELIVLTEQETQTRSKTARALFDEFVQTSDVAIVDTPGTSERSAWWREYSGRADDVFVARARLADLVVVERPAEAEAAAAMALNAVLFESGRPVLVPGGAPAEAVGRHVAIAWNASREAARAATAALPFLKRAEAVTVLTADSDVTSAERAGDLVDYLAWHGIAAQNGTVVSADGPVGARLLSACGAAGADLLVMGAYTHSRLRELIMGGVTRHVLAHATVPLLMAH